MKKSTLLSLVTAGAIVVTSAGTFALWDVIEAETKPATVTIDKAVTTEITDLNFTAPTRTELTTNAADLAHTSDVDITIKNVPEAIKDQYKLSYTYTVLKGGQESTDVTVKVEDAKAETIVAEDDLHTAKVTVTPTDSAVAGGDYVVTVKAKLVKKLP